MFLRNRSSRRVLSVFIAFVLIFTSAIACFATRDRTSSDGEFLTACTLLSKTIVMRTLDVFEHYLTAATYSPTPLDSTDFSYADLSHPYFDRIRKDKRLAKFYSQDKPISYVDALAIADHLHNRIAQGSPMKSYVDVNVLEMLDASEQGEHFLCGNFAKMLTELVQAGGTQARTVGLESINEGGHVAVEVWSRRFNKWAIIDPFFNVHYLNSSGIPLSAAELYKMAVDEVEVKNIKLVYGSSLDTLKNGNSEPDNAYALRLVDLYYKNGFTVHFYNRWVDKNLPRTNPIRSRPIMGYYVGTSSLFKLYYKHHSDILTNELESELYMDPSAYL